VLFTCSVVLNRIAIQLADAVTRQAQAGKSAIRYELVGGNLPCLWQIAAIRASARRRRNGSTAADIMAAATQPEQPDLGCLVDELCASGRSAEAHHRVALLLSSSSPSRHLSGPAANGLLRRLLRARTPLLTLRLLQAAPFVPSLLTRISSSTWSASGRCSARQGGRRPPGRVEVGTAACGGVRG
jgi:hypothetical protein